MKLTKLKHRQQGFTIIELMIATAVLSTILILVTVMMINIGNLLNKGINASRVQDATRNITDQLSQDLKYNNNVVYGSNRTTLGSQTVTLGAYCIGDSVRYSFIVGYKSGSSDTLSTPVTPHVLWRDDDSYNGLYTGSPLDPNYNASCRPVNVTSAALKNTVGGDTSGAELISPSSRLTAFCVNSNGGSCAASPASPYTLVVGLAYGDIDLFTQNTPATINVNTRCKGSTGDQFCSTSSLTTTIVQRIAGGS